MIDVDQVVANHGPMERKAGGASPIPRPPRSHATCGSGLLRSPIHLDPSRDDRGMALTTGAPRRSAVS